MARSREELNWAYEDELNEFSRARSKAASLPDAKQRRAAFDKALQDTRGRVAKLRKEARG